MKRNLTVTGFVISFLCILFLLPGCGHGNSLFDLMGSNTLKWADGFDSDNPPSLTIYQETDTSASDPVSISDPEKISQIFSALSEVTVSGKTDWDPEKTVYTFTFSDQEGKKQSFLLGEDFCVFIDNQAYLADGTAEVLSAAGLSLSEDSASPKDEDLSLPDAPLSGQEEDVPPSDSDTADDPSDSVSGDYLAFSSDLMEFSILYQASFTAQETSGGAAVIYTGNTTKAPFLQVLHVLQGPDACQYLEEQRYSAQYQFEDRLTKDGGEPAPVEAQSRDMYCIQFSYLNEEGATLDVISFAENLADQSIAVYTATFPTDDSDATIAALNDAINSFYPAANYYTDAADKSDSPAPSAADGSSYQLIPYENRIFTMQLPDGFTVETGGSYAGFCMRAYDPDNPDVQIFYYVELGPYFKSAAGKAGYQKMSGGSDSLCQLPVLDPATLYGCLASLNDYDSIYNSLMSSPYHFARINNLSVIAEAPVSTFLSDIATSESMLTASLTSATGGPCTGIFQGTIVDAGSYMLDNVDVSPSRSAMNIFGIIAPVDQFSAVSASLTESLCSFRFTDEYIQEGINATNMIGQSAAEYSRQNMEMMDQIHTRFLDYINDTVTIYVQD